MKPHVFREYDIRGTVPLELNNDTVKRLGRAIGTYYASRAVKKISLGRDCRLSSPDLSLWLCEGLLACGVDVVQIGMVPTPLLYFSLHHLKVEGGIQITGSHNPPEFNGFKVCVGTASIYGKEIQKIRDIYESGDFEKGKGSREEIEIGEDYLQWVQKNIQPGSVRTKVVVDAGNGAGGVIALELYRRIGFDVHPIHCEPDGNFPNHHPDPTIPDNLKDLRAKVAEVSANVGIAFDGDADRIGVVNETGEIIWGDQLMILFSRDLLKRHPGAKIIGEVKCSQALYSEIRKHGGKGIMWKVGHSLIKSKMKEENALLAGEMSGHIFFGERYFGYDDAIYAGARLLEILSKTRESLGELMSDVPKMVNTPEIRLDCPEEDKMPIVKAIGDAFKKDYDVVDIDGARVQFDDGWGLIRASNTQPVLVLRFEAKDQTALERIQGIFMDKLRNLGRG